jgi:ribosomal protein L7/L12
MFSLFSFGQAPSCHASRLLRIERKVDLIMQHLGIRYDDDATDGLAAEARSLADEGRKIEAIKLHRELTRTSLVEAKRAVEEYMGR